MSAERFEYHLPAEGQRNAGRASVFIRNGLAEIGGQCGDATFARQGIANESYRLITECCILSIKFLLCCFAARMIASPARILMISFPSNPVVCYLQMPSC